MVGRMTRAQLRRVIEGPLPEPVKYESGLVERILADVGDEAGCLTLLEFALTMLWERRRDHTLHHAAYEELGGVAGAPAPHAGGAHRRGLKAGQEPAARLVVPTVRPNLRAEPAPPLRPR